MAKLIGITGSIATGKSSVSNYLKDKGYAVFDSDSYVHDLYENDNDLIKRINKVFFNNELLESIDRKELAKVIFNDSNKKKDLESIIHPLVKKAIFKFKENIKDEVFFAEIPLLIEANMQNVVDEIWLISVLKEKQIERLVKRNNIDIDEAKDLINMQISLEEKEKFAHVIIDNSDDFNVTIDSLENELMWLEEDL